jgi:lysophospholipase L1-like esterase
MTGWNWLTQYEGYSWGFVLRVIVKASILFLILNALFAVLQPIETLGNMSLRANRERLPYGEDDRAYNLSTNNLAAMFASHAISQSKATDEFRVLLIGDSGTWGILLKPEETLAGYINNKNYTLADGRTIKAYNIGHPIMSLTKDLMLLDYAMQYDPDMIVWLTTLESFNRNEQLDPPIVLNNADRVQQLIETYALDLNTDNPEFVEPSFLDLTIVGQRRELSDLLRLQAFNMMWHTTGIDQYYPDDYNLRTEDFDEDVSWHEFDEPTDLTTDDLAFDVISAGIERAGDVPVLLVNEPIFISTGENSDLRYNTWYPQWAYDQYREIYSTLADENNWHYLDVWDIIDGAEFTDSPVHLTPTGSQQLSEVLGQVIVESS